MTNQGAGFDLANQIIAKTASFGSPIKEPKMAGRSLTFTLTPVNK